MGTHQDDPSSWVGDTRILVPGGRIEAPVQHGQRDVEGVWGDPGLLTKFLAPDVDQDGAGMHLQPSPLRRQAVDPPTRSTGSYASPAEFVDGLVPAVWVGAAIVAVGAVVALALPGRIRREGTVAGEVAATPTVPSGLPAQTAG